MHKNTYQYMLRLVHDKSNLDTHLDFVPLTFNELEFEFDTYIGSSIKKGLILQHFTYKRTL